VGGIPTPLETVRSAVLHDVTGDGKPEIIVPVRGGYEVFARRGGKLEKVVSLDGEHRVAVRAGGPSVLDPLEIEVRIARLKLKDLNGDGLLDISTRTKGTTRAHLQSASGFPAKPSYELDTSLFQEGGKEKGASERIIGSSGVKVHEVDIDGEARGGAGNARAIRRVVTLEVRAAAWTPPGRPGIFFPCRLLRRRLVLPARVAPRVLPRLREASSCRPSPPGASPATGPGQPPTTSSASWKMPSKSSSASGRSASRGSTALSTPGSATSWTPSCAAATRTSDS
jgi:hypothetical protein